MQTRVDHLDFRMGLLPGFDVLKVAAGGASTMVAYSVKASNVRQVPFWAASRQGSSFAG
jgi:hypothetical protein